MTLATDRLAILREVRNTFCQRKPRNALYYRDARYLLYQKETGNTFFKGGVKNALYQRNAFFIGTNAFHIRKKLGTPFNAIKAKLVG